MTKPIPMSEWQSENLPDALPLAFKRNIDPGDGGCWLWSRSRSKDGYGWASYRNKTYQAHRLSYSLVVGEPPVGSHLDHLCRIRHCVNPAHLQPVSPAENLRRSPYTPAGTTQCVKGHELSEWHGQRRCLVCKREYERVRLSGGVWESRRPWVVMK